MAKNYIQPGDVVTVAAPYDVDGGDIVVVGTLAGVACYSAKTGEPVEVKLTGVFELGKTSAQAWAIGAKIYATSTGVATTAASGNIPMGLSVEPAANPSPTGRVRLSHVA